MRSILRMRHYCDHCKKSTGTKHSMAKHESGCTLNPNRKCRVCELNGEAQLSMPELQAAFDNGFSALREACHDCPVCILATSRQFYQASEGWASSESPRDCGEWDFKTAMKEFWVSYNKEHRGQADYDL